MAFIGIKAQYTKRFCLMSLLPPEIKRELKATIKASTTGNGYKKIKDAILRSHGPKPGQDVAKAASLLLVGKPSALANELISLICKHEKPLETCCCENVIIYFWHKQLSNSVKIRIAGRSMKGQNNLQEVLQLADEVHATTTSNTTNSQRAHQVAAMKSSRQGGATQARPDGATAQSTQYWGPRHPDNPPDGCCRVHWRWGTKAYFCSDSANCPWVKRISPRPQSQPNERDPPD